MSSPRNFPLFLLYYYYHCFHYDEFQHELFIAILVLLRQEGGESWQEGEESRVHFVFASPYFCRRCYYYNDNHFYFRRVRILSLRVPPAGLWPVGRLGCYTILYQSE